MKKNGNNDIEVTTESLTGEDGALGYHGMLSGPDIIGYDFRIDTKQETLVYRVGYEGQPEINYTGAISSFAAITGSQDILKFARVYGPLQLCHHELPSGHSWSVEDYFGFPSKYLDLPTDHCRYATPDGSVGYWEAIHTREEVSEPLAKWHEIVGQFRALLMLIDALRNLGSKGSFELWEAAFTGPHDKDLAAQFDGDHEQLISLRLNLSDRITEWLHMADVRPTFFELFPGKSMLEWNTTTLGALAIQLLGTARGTQNLALCDYCQEMYEPTRRPRTGSVRCCQKQGCRRDYARDRQRKSGGQTHA